MRATERITGQGHRNILAENATTFEITKDTRLTKKGDCIIAVAADKAVKDLGFEMRRILQTESSKLTIIVEVEGEKEVVVASGSPKLTLKHGEDMVVRKSNYICERTLAIKASKCAKDLSRSLVAKMKTSEPIHVTLIAEDTQSAC
jgi:hypothetical protein